MGMMRRAPRLIGPGTTTAWDSAPAELFDPNNGHLSSVHNVVRARARVCVCVRERQRVRESMCVARNACVCILS